MAKDLEDITGIGKATAERLRNAGFDTLEKLADITKEELLDLNIKGIGSSTAQKYIDSAKKIVNESKGLEIIDSNKQMMKSEANSSDNVEKQPKTIKKSSLKELVKKQAECNIGLVGHVDHGKTTLVKSLTGDWTDRHSEEKERGISIKLGYSNATILYCPSCDEYLTSYMAEKARQKGKPRDSCAKCGTDLEFKRNISFVDAPGHEILMATMLSGASLMNGACLLVAADEECPQPQTREHLAALNIAGIENLIIIQNKIDAVSKEQAQENYRQIKEFVKGTLAEKAPIIPISAVFGANIELVVRAFEEIIPTPELDEDDVFQFLIARSFDINRPGTEIENLHGGVIGGSVLTGTIKIGEEVEIRPGLRTKNDYQPIKSQVVSISQGSNTLENARPGGLIGLGTKLDPAITKGDHLIGQLVGRPASLPPIISEVELKVKLLDRVIGSEDQIKVHELRHNEKLLLVVGTEKSAGTVTKILKNSYVLSLNPPICVPQNFIFAISRIINRRYRLIGYGEVVNQE